MSCFLCTGGEISILGKPSSNQSKFHYIIGDTFDFCSDPGRTFLEPAKM